MSDAPLLDRLAGYAPMKDDPQRRAADPAASVWVSANAGSGKTRVLVHRVLRLLLSGVSPGRILCLTYTKAAAAEMSNRLQKELAVWANSGPAALAADLEKLLGQPATEGEMIAARRLFFATLDAPTALRIHTIHSFCERLLQRFPLEAGVTPNFRVLEDAVAKTLLNGAIASTLASAAAEPESPLGRALAVLVGECAESLFGDTIRLALTFARDLALFVRDAGDHADELAAWRGAMSHAFALRTGRTAEVIETELSGLVSDSLADGAAAALSLGSTNDLKSCARFRAIREAHTAAARVAAIQCAFLKGGVEAFASLAGIMTGKIQTACPDLAAEIDALRAPVLTLTNELRGLRVVAASQALFTLTRDIVGRFRRAKDEEGVLDYDDLIDLALALLSRSKAAAWVLFKLDEGLGHILIDEAQDTNPRQWTLIERLVDEFFAGEGAAEGQRTVFAVGDEKQSIFSFQGADPDHFATTGQKFEQAAKLARRGFTRVPLTVSFRTTPPVLKAVDAVFGRPEAYTNLTSAPGAPAPHTAFRANQPGLVEIWPVERVETDDAPEAMDPLGDLTQIVLASDRLAARVASAVAGWCAGEERLESEDRPIQPGDVLILVRQRKQLASALIRALKARNVEVAGADRMRLAEQLAVMDLMALGDFLLLPDDDLALACVLKSPLFDLDDDDLFHLAYDRSGSLWSALCSRSHETPKLAAAAAALHAWRGRADFVPPFEFYASVLGEASGGMRDRILGRLGPEAADALDEFLAHALNYDRLNPPSLQGFLDVLRGGEIELKRDMEQSRDEVRVMTVHGAKGLEANVVILPDTCGMPQPPPSVHALRGQPAHGVEPPVWCIAGHGNVPVLADARGKLKLEQDNEHRRLLYVAMTRARERLYVCGFEGKQKRQANCWYNLVAHGLEAIVEPVELADGFTVRRYRETATAAAPARAKEPVGAPASPRPAWASVSAPAESRRALLAPSSLIGLDADKPDLVAEPAVSGPLALAEGNRFARGRLIHSLLQHLPAIAESRRMTVAERIVDRFDELDPEEQRIAIAETLTIIGGTDFASLFGPGSQAEVPLIGRLGEGEEEIAISGQIDRLVVGPAEILMADYKTNRPPPADLEDVPAAYVAQLAAYRGALRRIFPGRSVRAVLVWTDGPKLMEIPALMLDAAERRILAAAGDLDGKARRT